MYIYIHMYKYHARTYTCYIFAGPRHWFLTFTSATSENAIGAVAVDATTFFWVWRIFFTGFHTKIRKSAINRWIGTPIFHMDFHPIKWFQHGIPKVNTDGFHCGRCCCRWSIDVTSNGSSALRRPCFGRSILSKRGCCTCLTCYTYIQYLHVYIHNMYI